MFMSYSQMMSMGTWFYGFPLTCEDFLIYTINKLHPIDDIG